MKTRFFLYYSQKISSLCTNFLFGLVIFMPLICHAESESKTPASSKYESYEVNYFINPDGTFKKDVNFRLAILNSAGVKHAQSVYVSDMSYLNNPPENYDLKIVSSVLLKQNGSRIEGTENQPSSQLSTPKSSSNLGKWKIFSFKDAEIGDVIAINYVASLNKPLLNKAVVINEVISKSRPYDQSKFTLKAPSSLNLRVETQGLNQLKHLASPESESWVWEFQDPSPNLPFASIHISSFKSFIHESRVLNELSEERIMDKNENFCGANTIDSNGPKSARENNANKIHEYFWSNAKRLDALINAWTTNPCILDDGQNALVSVPWGLELAASKSEDLGEFFDRINEIKERHPNRPFIALAEAEYWESYAFKARGEGFASSVTPEGWRLFHERLEKAEQVLLDSKSYASALPGWHQKIIAIQFLLGRKDLSSKSFSVAIKQYPYYYPIYFTMVNFLQPKWGGSWEKVDELATNAVKNTKRLDGESAYTRIYWSVYGASLPDKIHFFKDTKANWVKMKKGFEDLMMRYPKNNWNLNNFAKFSCLANDKGSFISLRKKIGARIMDSAWDDISLDYCDTKFAYSEG